MTTSPDRTVGIRYLLLLIPLFAAVICAAFALSYPGQITAALSSLEEAAPLANPTLCIDGCIVPDNALLDDFAKIGTAVPAVICDTETVDGTSVRITAMSANALDGAVRLTDGRMPQSAQECVAVALYPTTAPAIGTTIIPCGEDGTALLTSDGETPYLLTVVGIGENTLSALAPIADHDIGLLVYTTADTDGVTVTAPILTDAGISLLLTDCTVPDPYTAAQELCRNHSEAQTAYLNAQAEETHTALLWAAQTADDAVTAQEILLQELDNRLDTATLRVTELENNMMDAVAALQAEQQQFVSDMEYNEYYALRQVDLIPRRNRAEEGYAKQEAVIDALNDELHTAYAERDAIAAERSAADATLTAMQTEADNAHAALDAWNSQPRSRSVSWEITCAEQEPGTARLHDHAAASAETAWVLSCAFAAVFFIGSIVVYSVSRRAGYSAIRFAVIAALTAIPAALFGGCVLTSVIPRHTFPALSDILAPAAFQPLVLLLLPAAALLAALSVLLGHRIHRTAAHKTT